MENRDLAEHLRSDEFEELFRRMGWDNPPSAAPAPVPYSNLRPVPVGEKRGLVAWQVQCDAEVPHSSERHRVVRALKRRSRNSLVVFTSRTRHLWLWPEQRPNGAGYRPVAHEYPAGAPTEALLQRIERASFDVAEEGDLSATIVLDRVRRSFNADKVTKSFYKEFNKHHRDFAEKIEGMPEGEDPRWYASVLLNRLMFIYFIQNKGFLDGDRQYLTTRLDKVRSHFGPNKFYTFFREFLLPLFHEGLGTPESERAFPDPAIEEIIGKVPYVNGGIFQVHELEQGTEVKIRDKAFESLFKFFDQWRWHLDDNPTGDDNEINPDILGFIFEQYINQKDTGAYYTKPDVTGYMAESAILPAVADRLAAAERLEDDPSVLLAGSGDDYIRDSILHGVDAHDSESWSSAPRAGDPPAHVASPGERWCDVDHRVKRCSRQRSLLADREKQWSIDEAVTENLDLRELLADYCSQLATADECQTAFDVLSSLTVCDPTAGSGAFLFAALDVLQPLYETVLARAAEIHPRRPGDAPAAFLAEANNHHSRRHWIIKTICLRNLYGVDIMAEAPEIAKLRLFLKLAAQINDLNDIEPLPDLDFNIKTGNLLIGIADHDDAKHRFGEDQLITEEQMAKLDALADDVAEAQEQFIAAQSQDTGDTDLSEPKQQLNSRLQAARSAANRLLYELRVEQKPLDKWIASHQPFHWFLEFPGVWRDGGFDVVLGNPPYIEAATVKRRYRWQGYKTQACRDLYAVCTERASRLLNAQGRMAMIVMHSLCFSSGYAALRDHLDSQFETLWLSSYSRSPGGLFSGSSDVRNTIVVTGFSQQGLYTTRCRRWAAESRPVLFDSIEFTKPPEALMKCGDKPIWPFVDGQALAAAFEQTVQNHEPINDVLVRRSDIKLGFKTTALHMLGLFEQEPPTVDPRTGQRVSTKSKRSSWMYFDDAAHRDLALLVLAGRWGFNWWLMCDDSFDVNKGVLTAMPAGIRRLVSLSSDDGADAEDAKRLLALAQELKLEMPKHLEWKLHAKKKVGKYNLLKCSPITDEADLLLAKLWGVTDAYEDAGNLRDRMVFGHTV